MSLLHMSRQKILEFILAEQWRVTTFRVAFADDKPFLKYRVTNGTAFKSCELPISTKQAIDVMRFQLANDGWALGDKIDEIFSDYWRKSELKQNSTTNGAHDEVSAAQKRKKN
jgi:hypothetical protein